MDEGGGAPAAGPIRVAVWAAARVVAEALAAAVAARPDLEVVEVAGRVAAARAAARPDVVVVDVSRADQRGVERLVQARRRRPEGRLLAVGMASEEEVVALAEVGAVGYVLKSAAPRDLVLAIRAAHAGRARCSPTVLAALAARARELAAASAAEPQPGAAPTRRQVQVLEMLAEGLGNKQIAQRLGISRQTAKNHVHRLLETLGVHRRHEAVRVAYRARILDGSVPGLAVGKGGAGE